MPNPLTLSVLDPRRPENNLRNTSATGRYVFRVPTPRVPKVTFSLGWELEANRKAARVPSGIEVTSDGSVDNDSTEYIVLPSIVRSARFSLMLLKELVHAPELNTNKSCGFHVHMSPNGVALNKMRLWAKACETLALAVEGKAFEAVPDARQSNSYCRPIRPLEEGHEFSAAKYNNDRRYQWLNTVEMFRPGGIRTVEVRLLGNTHRWKYLLAWSTFCLLLGREAWKLVYNPSNLAKSVDLLTGVLLNIREDVKPLAKRSEPIPQWVYEALTHLGIDFKAWDRPLAKLIDSECSVTGRRKMFYSDAQATIDHDSNDDDCPCGCDNDGRCADQVHNDGDCSSNECERCCENGDCDGSPSCDNCRYGQHQQRNYCGGRRCTTCIREGRIPMAEQNDHGAYNNEEIAHEAANQMMTVHPSNVSTIQNPSFYGVSVVQMIYDESVNVASNLPSLDNDETRDEAIRLNGGTI